MLTAILTLVLTSSAAAGPEAVRLPAAPALPSAVSSTITGGCADDVTPTECALTRKVEALESALRVRLEQLAAERRKVAACTPEAIRTMARAACPPVVPIPAPAAAPSFLRDAGLCGLCLAIGGGAAAAGTAVAVCR